MSNKLNIENRTTWSTKDLEKIFVLCSKKYGYTPKKIIIYYSRKDGIGGWGTYGRGYVKIGLPHTKEIYNLQKQNSLLEKQINKIELLEKENIELKKHILKINNKILEVNEKMK